VSSVNLILRTDPNAGLCETCQRVRRITSDRGSKFYLCKLSTVDQRYPKYPRLPVLNCDGYVADRDRQEVTMSPPPTKGDEDAA
jgi:hypothetical protein